MPDQCIPAGSRWRAFLRHKGTAMSANSRYMIALSYTRAWEAAGQTRGERGWRARSLRRIKLREGKCGRRAGRAGLWLAGLAPVHHADLVHEVRFCRARM